MSRPLRSLLRHGRLIALPVGGTACAVGAVQLAVDPLRRLSDPVRAGGLGAVARVPPDVAVVGLCAVALLGCVLWLAGVTVLALASYGARQWAPGHRRTATVSRVAARTCPAVVQRTVASCLGVAALTGWAAPAPAAPAAAPPARGESVRADLTGGQRDVRLLDGLALPDRVVGPVTAVTQRTRPGTRPARSAPAPIAPPAAPARAGTATRAAPPPALRWVVVRRGDCLWSIAAGLLPAGVPYRTLGATWRRLYRSNLTRIGDDPDLILPGTRLVVPAPAPTHPEEPR